MTAQATPTRDAFHAALERDLADGRVSDPQVVEWNYIRRTRAESDQQVVFSFHGPRDLLHWIADRFNDLETPQPPRPRAYWARPSYLPHYDDLIARSAEAHETLLADVGDYDRELYHHRFQDIYNVQDFHYCTAIGTGIRTVVDFGAGYARQAMLFATELEDARYVAVDAVEQSYLLQNWVLDRLGLLRWDYIDESEAGSDALARALAEGPGAFHLPTWRLDLLPPDSVDLALFVWSLYEMSGEAARTAMDACRRAMRVGGYVYIRDMPHSVSYDFDPERLLRDAGFELIYRPRSIAHDELHGQQRLYRRTAERYRSPLERRARGLARRVLKRS